MQFEWDPDKAESNFTKHEVSFKEASSVSSDPLHSEDDARLLTPGLSSEKRVLIVWHTERDNGIRIIGARDVTTQERRVYESGECNRS